MANRYPLILDTDDDNRLKELPNGDSLNLTGNAIVGVSNISSTGSLSIAGITASGAITAGGDITTTGDVNGASFNIGGTSVLELVDYTNLLNIPTFGAVATSNSYTDLADKPLIPTDISELDDINDLLAGITAFTGLSDTPDAYTGQAGYTLVVNGTEDGLTFTAGASITSGSIIAALGYTPYNGAANSLNFLTSISTINITDALGYTPYSSTNPAGYITGETQTLDDVVQNGATTSLSITAAGFTTTGTVSAGNVEISSDLILTSTGTINLNGGAGSTLAIGGTSALSLRSSGNIDVQAGVIPNVTGSYDIGSNAARFGSGYFNSTVTSADFATNAASSTFTLNGSLLFQPAATGRVGISQGVFNLPVITTTQRNAITAQDGDLIFNNTRFIPEFRQNNQWRPITPIAGGQPTDPWIGMLAVADGSTWNPAGTGTECLMCYLDAAWVIVAQGS